MQGNGIWPDTIDAAACDRQQAARFGSQSTMDSSTSGMRRHNLLEAELTPQEGETHTGP
jgi:hypothetical protein